MNNTTIMLALSIIAVSSGCAAEGDAPVAEPRSTAVISVPAPVNVAHLRPVDIRLGLAAGEAAIVGNDVQRLLPVPAQPRRFANRVEFLEFLHRTVNAEIVTNEDGSRGATGYLQIAGELGYIDSQTHQLRTVRRPLTTLIGGEFGYFYIGDERIPVEPDAGAQPLESLQRCDPGGVTNQFCATFESLYGNPYWTGYAEATCVNIERVAQTWTHFFRCTRFLADGTSQATPPFGGLLASPPNTTRYEDAQWGWYTTLTRNGLRITGVSGYHEMSGRRVNGMIGFLSATTQQF